MGKFCDMIMAGYYSLTFLFLSLVIEKKNVLITYENNEGPDQPTNLHSEQSLCFYLSNPCFYDSKGPN